MAEWRLRVTTVVLLVLSLGQAEVEQPAVGIDPMASEAGELVDRNLRDALAERAWWPCGCSVAGGLTVFQNVSAVRLVCANAGCAARTIAATMVQRAARMIPSSQRRRTRFG
jgi:hypothetical protein